MVLQHADSTEHYIVKNDVGEIIGHAYVDSCPNKYKASNIVCSDNVGYAITSFYTDLPINRVHDEILQAYKEHYNEN